MGDTGSLALGSAFACVAIMTNTEIASLVIGGLFIAEALSVMIQVVSFKATGKRVFLMAPIHHHFEKLGWAETRAISEYASGSWRPPLARSVSRCSSNSGKRRVAIMPLPQTMSLLVLGQGTSGTDVVRWALAHPERVSHITLYGGTKSAPTPDTLELERAGVACVYGTEDVAGTYDVCVASPGISEFSPFFASARAHATEVMGEPEFAYRLSPER